MIQQTRYIDAVQKDLQSLVPKVWGRPVQSIYFGGGTPSLFAAEQFDRLLADIRTCFPLRPDIEISMEMNPGSVALSDLHGFKEAGMNRLSIGAQSFDDTALKGLGRIHNAAQIGVNFQLARAAGFSNINLDLMYGLPRQTVAAAKRDLDQALALHPDHLSYYQLTLEPNTYFYKYPPPLPDEERLWQIEQAAHKSILRAGFRQYEVSAFSRNDTSCQHNINYWQFGDYIGVGAGAHGKITQADGVYRQIRPKAPEKYMLWCEQGATGETEHKLNNEDLLFEFLLNALRLKNGFKLELFSKRTGLPANVVAQHLQKASLQGMIEWGHTVKASERGYRYLNGLLQDFVPEQRQPASATKL